MVRYLIWNVFGILFRNRKMWGGGWQFDKLEV